MNGGDPIEITGYVYAGSPAAYEALGPAGFADVSCVHCGARISHVFQSSIGPLGGDCAASLTGDNVTRSAVRRQLAGALRRMRGGKVSTVRVTSDGTVYGSVRGSGHAREYDGAVVGRREVWLVSAKTERIGRTLAVALVDRINAEEPAYRVTMTEKA